MSSSLRFRLTFAGLMSLLMSTLMSAWITWINLGFGPEFVDRWLHGLAAAWPVAFTVVVVAPPFVQNLARRLAGVTMPACAPVGASAGAAVRQA